MMTETERIVALETRIAQLEARLADLERRGVVGWPPTLPFVPSPVPPWTVTCESGGNT